MTRAEMKQRAKASLGNSIFSENWLLALLVVVIESAIIGVTSGVAILVTGPLTYGVAYLFIKQARDGQKMEIAELFKGFSDDFGGTLVLQLLISLFTALWSMLFVIPGIVKTYAYSMAFYIKQDHPDYGWKQCIDESQAMMKGHKMELFILDLSFIGWYIVGSLVLGIGLLWVVPYHTATRTQFYEALR